MPDLVRVFISYSHDSDAHRGRIHDLATRLREHGIDAWIDQFSPAPVEGWPRWMEHQFAQARFVVVACTEPYAERFNRPPGVGSGVGWESVLIRQELYEQGGNTRFVPVYFDGSGSVVPLVLRPYPRYLLPRDYEDLRKHLLGEFGKDVPALGSPLVFEGARPDLGGRPSVKLWNVPPRPAQYLPREELDALKVSLISSKTQTVAIAGEHHRLGIQGMPGVGKTVIAAALAADADIHEAFPGGVFWLTLGRTPDDVVVWQGKLAQALAGRPVEIRTAREGKTTLGELFAARPPSLLILDDVWNIADADPFDAPAAPSRLLITTRNQEVAQGLGATVREIRELKPTDALVMLAAYAGRPMETLPKVAQEIVSECGELPLAVAMAGAMLQGRPDDQWPTLLEQLKNADLEHLAAVLPQYRQHRSMLAAIEVSVQELPEDVRLRYLDFAVFPEDVEVPEPVLHRLWGAAGVKLFDAQQTVNVLADRSLVRRVQHARHRAADRRGDEQDPLAPPPKDEEVYLTLHDLQHDYVRARGGDLAPRHARLLDAYRSTSPGKALHAVEADGYFFEHIARHVRDGEGTTALRALLFDHCWLAAKLNATGVNALLSDFELVDLASDEPLRLLRDALRLSAHVLSHRPEELPAQLIGRLRHTSQADLTRCVARMEHDIAPPVLLPLWPALAPVGGPLLRTIETLHEVFMMALTEDGKTAITDSLDGTLSVWDVESGKQIRTLAGHQEMVVVVALTPNGTMAISGSEDGTLGVWEVETGKELRTLGAHRSVVQAVALTADGAKVLSGSHDGELKVWDVAAGLLLWTLQSRQSPILAVAMTPDGRTAISGSADGTLATWDVVTGQELWTVKGHESRVNAVALSADGQTAISGSNDKTVKVWSLPKGERRHVLEGHTGPVNVVALTADGRRAISGGEDVLLKVWDIVTGKEILMLEDNQSPVLAVALTADGKTAVSCADDKTLRVWNIAASAESRFKTGYPGRIDAVALARGGRTAISGDDELKVWDVDAGTVTRSFKHERWVCAVALSADGNMAISSSDRTLRVWDIAAGKEIRTLGGHEGLVTAIALADDGKTVISGSEDKTLKVWNVTTGELLWTFTGHQGSVNVVAIAGDGKTALSNSGTQLKIWDLATGRELGILAGHRNGLLAVAVSADGRTAISGSFDGDLRLWDIAMGRELRAFNGHQGDVSGVVLTEDGKTVISAAYDRTLRVWDLGTGTCLTTFTSDVGLSSLAVASSRIFAADCLGRVHLFELRLGLSGPRS